jgi:D-alanyl-D-alanine carboxypeptidase
VSRSPFIAGSSRRARALERRRRRRRSAALLGLILAAAAVAAGAVYLVGHHAARRPSSLSLTQVAGDSTATPAPPPSRSPLGLPLGRPPLALRLDAADPVHLRFRTPPRAGLLFNLSSGRVLWQRNALARMPIASLTKMMTALLVVQRAPANARVLITPEALAFQGSGVGLLPRGKRVSLEALLGGLLLPSGNDAAIALAQHVSGTVGQFVRLMNEQAATLGLSCTRYSSPSGFYDQFNYSCAADLAELAAEDLGQPRIAAITRRASIIVPFPIKGGRLFLYNNNPLVRLGYPGVTGLKTGYTQAAGSCLVATAERGGVRLGVVLLNSPDPPTQARQLLDRGFEGVYHQRAAPSPLIPPVPVVPAAGQRVGGSRRGG